MKQGKRIRIVFSKSSAFEPTIANMIIHFNAPVNILQADTREAAKSMGATNFDIIFHVLLVESRTSIVNGATIALGTILGYSAMAGTVGGGGLGDIAVRYGYYRWQTDIIIVTVILIIILFQIFQNVGMTASKVIDNRR